MRELVVSKIDAYMDSWTTNTQRQKLILCAIMQIEQAGGRFFKEDNYHGWWSMVDNNAARQKVGVCFQRLQRQAIEMAKEQHQQQAMTTSAITTLQAQGQHKIVLDSSIYGFCQAQESRDTCTLKGCL